MHFATSILWFYAINNMAQYRRKQGNMEKSVQKLCPSNVVKRSQKTFKHRRVVTCRQAVKEASKGQNFWYIQISIKKTGRIITKPRLNWHEHWLPTCQQYHSVAVGRYLVKVCLFFCSLLLKSTVFRWRVLLWLRVQKKLDEGVMRPVLRINLAGAFKEPSLERSL